MAVASLLVNNTIADGQYLTARKIDIFMNSIEQYAAGAVVNNLTAAGKDAFGPSYNFTNDAVAGRTFPALNRQVLSFTATQTAVAGSSVWTTESWYTLASTILAPAVTGPYFSFIDGYVGMWMPNAHTAMHLVTRLYNKTAATPYSSVAIIRSGAAHSKSTNSTSDNLPYQLSASFTLSSTAQATLAVQYSKRLAAGPASFLVQLNYGYTRKL